MGAARDLFRSRKQPPEGVEVITDLDALMEKPIYFRFKGEAFKIDPMSTRDCLQTYAEFVNVQSLAKKESITGDEIITAYTELFQRVCPQFTRKHVEQLTPTQLGALYVLVIKTITGEQQAEKKTPLMVPTQGSSA